MQKSVLHVAAALVLLSSAAAQSKGDWDAVRRIDRGTPIKVKAGRNAKCEFRDATDDQLFCDPLFGHELVFNRLEIHQIRREFTRGKNGEIGAAVGAGIGAAAGAAMPVHNIEPGHARLLNATITALFGACAGWIIARNAPIFHDGIIYQR